METNRRNFLKMSGMGIAFATLPSFAYSTGLKANVKKPAFTFQLGIASYSLRKFSLEDTLKMTKRLNISRMSFKDYHLKLDSSDELIAETVKKCNDTGIRLYGGGVIYMRSNEDVDRAFEYAKKAGMEIIIGVPKQDLLPYVEQKVKLYNIKLAIHNHGPKDTNYPSAESAYVKIKDMDPRMGLCIDVGHTKRIGREPEKDLKDFFERVFDIHIKDVDQANEKGTTVEIGRGIINIPAFLKEAVRLKYSGTMALEFEKDADDPLPGMAESLGYIRGVMAAL
ncbi:MAG TPA: TIM barrel protein [Bacteroidales bacterium]|nr:TIM barrel protein [Bacteroidales bacterium]